MTRGLLRLNPRFSTQLQRYLAEQFHAVLGDQVAAPDLWDDQDNATRVTGKLSFLQGTLDRFLELEGRIEDVGVLIELGQEEGDEDSIAEAERELGRCLLVDDEPWSITE